MDGGQQAPDSASTESMAAFMARRRRQTSEARRARTTAHQAYGDAIRNGLDLSLSQPSDLRDFGAHLLNGLPQGAGGNAVLPGQFGGGIELPTTGFDGGPESGSAQGTSPPASAALAPSAKPRSNLHPGFAESLIPVWGSAKEAYADAQDGDYVGAGINGVLAASDLFLAGDVAKAIAKGGWYVARGPLLRKASQQNWKAVRKQLGKNGVLAKYQEGHHWLIPQNGWGKNVPDMIKNHPLNIKAMPDRATHRRITGRYQGMPRFNWFDRYRYGTPTWSKVFTVDAAGHPTAAAMAAPKK